LNLLEHPESHEVVAVELMAVKLAFALEIAPPASGNIAGVDRETCLGKFAKGAGTAVEEREDELKIVSQPEDEAGNTAEVQ
jgi:hypothetical protein